MKGVLMSNSCPGSDPAWIATDEKWADNTCDEFETLSRDKFSGEATGHAMQIYNCPIDNC